MTTYVSVEVIERLVRKLDFAHVLSNLKHYILVKIKLQTKKGCQGEPERNELKHK